MRSVTDLPDASRTEMRLTIWSEHVQDRDDPSVRAVYPEGIHSAIAAGVREHLGAQATVSTGTFAQPNHGLGPEVLERTDVLTWWGHVAQDDVGDAVIAAIRERVLRGMGLVVLHSGCGSKLFCSLMATSCSLSWRKPGERELVWNVAPAHPIANGIPEVFSIPQNEVYGEFFDIPPPDELVFISSFTGGEVFRSGCCFVRGRGRIFFFSPGDQAYPVFYQPEVRRIIANAQRWAFPTNGVHPAPYDNRRAVEIAQ